MPALYVSVPRKSVHVGVMLWLTNLSRRVRALDNELNSFARLFDFPGLELDTDRHAQRE